MSVVFGAATVAFRISLSALRVAEGVAGSTIVGMRRLWAPDFGDGRNDIPRHTHAAACVVSDHVVGDHAEKWRQRVGIAASAGLEELRDGMDVAAQTAPCDGEAGA